jgi:hypothetical protein
MRPWSAHVGQEVRLIEYNERPVGCAHFRGRDASGEHAHRMNERRRLSNLGPDGYRCVSRRRFLLRLLRFFAAKKISRSASQVTAPTIRNATQLPFSADGNCGGRQKAQEAQNCPKQKSPGA